MSNVNGCGVWFQSQLQEKATEDEADNSWDSGAGFILEVRGHSSLVRVWLLHASQPFKHKISLRKYGF